MVVVPPSTAPPAEAPRSWTLRPCNTVVLFEDAVLTDTTSIAPAEIVVWLHRAAGIDLERGRRRREQSGRALLAAGRSTPAVAVEMRFDVPSSWIAGHAGVGQHQQTARC